MQRRSLTDILSESDRESLAQTWKGTEAAADFAPLPGGTYVARIVRGELSTSSSNATPGYKLTFQTVEGEHEGRRFWHDLWLTEAAMPRTKRDLAKLGVTSLEQLEQPLPQGIRCSVLLACRTAEDGTQHNRVKRFEVIDIDEVERDPFAPDDDCGEGGTG